MSATLKAVGIDIGGTYTKLGVVDSSATVITQELLQTASQGDPSPFFETLRTKIQWLVNRYHPVGIGLSIPGLLTENRQVIAYNPNTPALAGIDFCQELSSLGLPLAFETDLNTPALAEYHFGERRGNPRLLTAVIGTGLGAAVVLDGELLRFFGGVAGDNGHIILQPGGSACTAGCRGCAEAMISTSAIEQSYKLAAGDSRASRLQAEIARNVPIARAVIQAAVQGDPLAVEIMTGIGDWLGQWLASLVAMFKPQVIVLCGGVAEAGEALRSPADARLRQLAGPAYTADCQVITGKFCGQAGMIGAVVPLLMGKVG